MLRCLQELLFLFTVLIAHQENQTDQSDWRTYSRMHSSRNYVEGLEPVLDICFTLPFSHIFPLPPVSDTSLLLYLLSPVYLSFCLPLPPSL